jgi:basic membrane protein A and related proteins
MPRRLVIAVVAVAVFASLGSDPAGSAQTQRDQIKVGLVAGSEEDPFVRAAVAGLRRAVRKLGVTAEVRTPTPREGFTASYAALAAKGFDLVMGFPTSNLFALVRIARRSPPGVHFAIVDLSRRLMPGAPHNVSGIAFRRQEAGYLAGFLAGLVERRESGRDVVSAIGGERQPGVDTWVAGYRAGAKRAAPRIGFLYSYSNSYTAREACTAIASNQISKGSGVVFGVAGRCGIGALRTAGRRHVWGVGVDQDQSWVGPQMLTSAVLHLDTAVYDVIRAVKDGSYRDGVDRDYGVRNGGVGLGPTNPRVPRLLRARVDRIRRQIASGKIVVPATLP